jgi:hypothetical protein
MNKQQKQLKKLGLASRNGGAGTTVTKINHGAYAFQEPAVAIDRKKRNNVRTWKITKRHPSQIDKSKNGKR